MRSLEPRQTAKHKLRADALAIWRAGVDAVDAGRLVQAQLGITATSLRIGDDQVPLSAIDRVVVVGAGKAAAAMAAGVECALLGNLPANVQLTGWVNVPDDCVRSLRRVHVHAARPAGVNAPMPEGVAGTQEILRLLDNLTARDLCLCLLSGGGSALLPAPVPGISLADKQAVTRYLSAAGANIRELNIVRTQLSRVKGGGLARRCRAGRLISLIISDVIGDPLDVIASGPTVATSSTPAGALEVLQRYDFEQANVAPAVIDLLRAAKSRTATAEPGSAAVTNLVIGNNSMAVAAAAAAAESRGYKTHTETARALEGRAEDVGRDLAARALQLRAKGERACLVSGGEPVVELVSQPGRGGRNQQLVLAALQEVLRQTTAGKNPLHGIALLSGGTDGEDGPTDAAGAIIDAAVLNAMRARSLDPAPYLDTNNAYRFFEPLDALIRTGPTETNVCDLRVVTVRGRG